MSDARSCPDCGRPLTEDAPEGLCPACLLKLALGDSAIVEGASPSPPGAPTEPPPPPGGGATPAETETRPWAAGSESPVTGAAGTGTDVAESPPPGVVRYFGDYELRGTIARGGMG